MATFYISSSKRLLWYAQQHHHPNQSLWHTWITVIYLEFHVSNELCAHKFQCIDENETDLVWIKPCRLSQRQTRQSNRQNNKYKSNRFGCDQNHKTIIIAEWVWEPPNETISFPQFVSEIFIFSVCSFNDDGDDAIAVVILPFLMSFDFLLTSDLLRQINIFFASGANFCWRQSYRYKYNPIWCCCFMLLMPFHRRQNSGKNGNEKPFPVDNSKCMRPASY